MLSKDLGKSSIDSYPGGEVLRSFMRLTKRLHAKEMQICLTSLFPFDESTIGDINVSELCSFLQFVITKCKLGIQIPLQDTC